MEFDFNTLLDKLKSKQTIVYVLYALAAITAVMGVIIMTDVGQLMGVSKSTVVWYFKNSVIIMVLSFIFLVLATYFANKILGLKRIWLIGIAAIWLGCIISSKYLTPYFLFRSQQNKSVYISIPEAKNYLKG